MGRLSVPLALAVSLLVSCGDDSSDSTDSSDSNPAATAAPEATPAETAPVDSIDPSTVRVYTSAEVCDLVPLDVASAVLGVDVTDASASEMSTPQCSYNFRTDDGTFTNLTLAVQRPIEDLGGAAGRAGFDATTSLVIFDTPYEPLAGVGDAAAVSASESLTLIAVLANNQVFTIATSANITLDNLVSFAQEVAQQL